jgi:hypothetical protein
MIKKKNFYNNILWIYKFVDSFNVALFLLCQ